VRWEVKRALGEETWAWRERERDQHATGRVVRRQGVQTPPPRPGSSSKGEVERGVILPPSFPLRATPSPHWDMVPLQTGAIANKRRPKHPCAEARPPTGLPSQLLPLRVISNREGEDDPFVCTSGEKVGVAPSFEIQQVLVILASAMTASPSSLEEVGPPPKKDLTRNCLSRSARYVRDTCCMLIM
jgi:hypothetical protein